MSEREIENPSTTYAPNEIPEEEQATQTADDVAADIVLEDGDASLEAVSPQDATPPSWRVAKALLALREQVNAMAPNRRKKSDGTIGDAAHASRASDHNPWVRDGATGVVTAMDITNDPDGGCDAGALANALLASRDPRIKYVIFNRRIASYQQKGTAAPFQWRPYAGSNPHTHHVHISVREVQTAYDSTSPWTIR
ncbi:MAG TPA: hypothetical protein VND45_12165 [Thermoanaerobaculia bacterium]|nr:hypothetical protein [Thermoanaerobaculia bacterium]